MSERYDEINHPARRKEDQDGADVYPGRRREDIYSRIAGKGPGVQSVVESGGTGIAVHGHLIVCMASEADGAPSAISDLVQKMDASNTS